MKKAITTILLLTLLITGCSLLDSKKPQEVVDKVKDKVKKETIEEVKKEGQEMVEQITGIAAIRTKQMVDPTLAEIKARALYNQKLLEGVDFSSGPCLSNDLMPDWVADIAHDPRTAEDDLPENQCSAFREGKAHHFVELDLEGNLIRAY